jgi:hypothetical protein
MADRQVSPFNPGRRALLEPIRQPLYSAATLTGATPESKLSFWPVPAAVQNDPVFAYGPWNQLPNPKMFIIDGFRLHFAQRVTMYGANVNPLDDMVNIMEQYWYRVFVGTKIYLQVPAFWVPSGLGITGSISIAQGIAAAIVTNSTSLHANYAKITARPITIPPQQVFECDLNARAGGVAALNANRLIWTFWEGTLGREVM